MQRGKKRETITYLRSICMSHTLGGFAWAGGSMWIRFLDVIGLMNEKSQNWNRDHNIIEIRKWGEPSMYRAPMGSIYVRTLRYLSYGWGQAHQVDYVRENKNGQCQVFHQKFISYFRESDLFRSYRSSACAFGTSVAGSIGSCNCSVSCFSYPGVSFSSAIRTYTYGQPVINMGNKKIERSEPLHFLNCFIHNVT